MTAELSSTRPWRRAALVCRWKWALNAAPILVSAALTACSDGANTPAAMTTGGGSHAAAGGGGGGGGAGGTGRVEPPPHETQAIGSDWVRRGESLLLQVPSIIRAARE